MRIAVVGSGGAGKSVVAGTIARLIARRGRRVLALDSDLMPGLGISLGAHHGRPALADAVERTPEGRWRLRRGIGAARAVTSYSSLAPDGIRLLEAGKLGAAGLEPIMGSLHAYYQVVHRLGEPRALREWAFVGDLPAGPRQAAFDWAPYAKTFLVVVEPTWKSALAGRRMTRIVRSRPAVRACIVANKVAGAADERRVADLVRKPVLGSIPLDLAVAAAERRGDALIDQAPSSPALAAIERLVERLESDAIRDHVGAA